LTARKVPCEGAAGAPARVPPAPAGAPACVPPARERLLRAINFAPGPAPRMNPGPLQGANMETRTTAPATAQDALGDPLALWTTLLDLPRQQSAMATHAACAMFSGFEALRRIQEQAAHAALQHYQHAAQRLDRQCAPVDVLSVQMDLARFDAEAAAAYWQQVVSSALQTQAQVAACAGELVDSEKVLAACAMLDGH
jgi:hypothetical protein